MKISRTRDFELVAKLNKYVHDLHANLYPEYFKEYNFEEIKIFFQKIIDQEEFAFLLLEDDEQPLGYAWIEFRNYPANTFKKAYKSVYVHQISITENQRKKGYGSKLMDEITDIAKVNGINKIELDYWFNNEIAKNFYKKNDFVKYREFVYKDI
ncbi:ribosomal protein S18 acetylase RimI-like enzyme [Cytobacillus eiseniae]|uniref:Ribosomal protein S18 acetylase RimI-like enzyme n=1 Tax=Cytobacillus eiseniae TaxID=762947 RepID=A0ABS4RLC4_9BACI|nr:GNAT family N-acetyltransferase [Cytobacillus eiseniae]MBP2243165.1 ribosomal protein S18 acetylase RimI-like enzyme [Cytobacillus eiseniae]